MLWSECVKSDRFGDAGGAELKTTMKRATFFKAKKIIEDYGAFKFDQYPGRQDGRKTRWFVTNLHGANRHEYWEDYDEKTEIQSTPVDSSLQANSQMGNKERPNGIEGIDTLGIQSTWVDCKSLPVDCSSLAVDSTLSQSLSVLGSYVSPDFNQTKNRKINKYSNNFFVLPFRWRSTSSLIDLRQGSFSISRHQQTSPVLSGASQKTNTLPYTEADCDSLRAENKSESEECNLGQEQKDSAAAHVDLAQSDVPACPTPDAPVTGDNPVANTFTLDDFIVSLRALPQPQQSIMKRFYSWMHREQGKSAWLPPVTEIMSVIAMTEPKYLEEAILLAQQHIEAGDNINPLSGFLGIAIEIYSQPHDDDDLADDILPF